jgi:hypothetical protein
MIHPGLSLLEAKVSFLKKWHGNLSFQDER